MTTTQIIFKKLPNFIPSSLFREGNKNTTLQTTQLKMNLLRNVRNLNRVPCIRGGRTSLNVLVALKILSIQDPSHLIRTDSLRESLRISQVLDGRANKKREGSRINGSLILQMMMALMSNGESLPDNSRSRSAPSEQGSDLKGTISMSLGVPRSLSLKTQEISINPMKLKLPTSSQEPLKKQSTLLLSQEPSLLALKVSLLVLLCRSQRKSLSRSQSTGTFPKTF